MKNRWCPLFTFIAITTAWHGYTTVEPSGDQRAWNVSNSDNVFYMTFFFLSLLQEDREPTIGTKPRIIVLLILTSLKEHPPNPTILFSLRIGSGSRLWKVNFKQNIILWTSFTLIILPKEYKTFLKITIMKVMYIPYIQDSWVANMSQWASLLLASAVLNQKNFNLNSKSYFSNNSSSYHTWK